MRMRRRNVVGIVVAVVATATAAFAPLVRAEDPPTAAVLWGDSLAVEAAPDWLLHLRGNGLHGEAHVLGGTAVCDWLPDIEPTVDRLRPAVVVFSFVGADLTPCMQGVNGERLSAEAVAARYRADAHRATLLAGKHGAQVVWTAGPVPRSPHPSYHLVDAAFREVADVLPQAHYVSGNRLLAPYDRYAYALPCLTWEPCTLPAVGHNVVRAPDGLHFCPSSVPGDDGTCDVYSSGSRRYAAVLGDPVLDIVSGFGG